MESGGRRILVYSNSQLWAVAAVVVLVLLLSAWWLFDLGKRRGVMELADLRQQRTQLEAALQQAVQETRKLQARIAVLERSSQIDRQASLGVRGELAKAQDELAQLRKELDFYRGIVSPGEMKPGLRIQRFQVEPAGCAGCWFYSLTLTQVKRNDRYVRGVVELRLEGIENDQPKSLSLAELAGDKDKVLKYGFRYFQHFEGELHLPAGFRPQRVRIRLVPKGRGQPAGIEENLRWPAPAGGP